MISGLVSRWTSLRTSLASPTHLARLSLQSVPLCPRHSARRYWSKSIKLDNVQLGKTQERKWRCLRCGTTTRNKQKSATLKKVLFPELFTIMFRAGWRLSHGCRFTWWSFCQWLYLPKSGSPPHLLLEVSSSKWVGEPDYPTIRFCNCHQSQKRGDVTVSAIASCVLYQISVEAAAETSALPWLLSNAQRLAPSINQYLRSPVYVFEQHSIKPLLMWLSPQLPISDVSWVEEVLALLLLDKSHPTSQWTRENSLSCAYSSHIATMLFTILFSRIICSYDLPYYYFPI